MSEQTYKGDIDWVVVDDCNPTTRCHMGQTVVRPKRIWTAGGKPSLVTNIDLGLSACRYEKILFIEDDECYLPQYLESMDEALDRSCIAGQTPARYYNVFHRAFRVIPNSMHASLCQTGIRSTVVPILRSIISRHGSTNPFIDIPLWQHCRALPGIPGSVSFDAGLRPRKDVMSIKGMPGRPGIGAGHRVPSGHWTLDPDLEWLTAQIGTERAMFYRTFAEHSLKGGETIAAM